MQSHMSNDSKAFKYISMVIFTGICAALGVVVGAVVFGAMGMAIGGAVAGARQQRAATSFSAKEQSYSAGIINKLSQYVNSHRSTSST